MSLTDTQNRVLEEVIEGLQDTPKHISSKFFYNKVGDELFERIMELPEYYLTRSEYEILSNQKEEILQSIGLNNIESIIELGAGNAFKTKILLKYLLEQNSDFKFQPIDISQNALNKLGNDLKVEMPNLNFSPLQGEYFEVLKHLKSEKKQKSKLILFLGSSIGNLSNSQTNSFLKALYESLNPGDFVLIGFDLTKHPQTILDAYNDKAGVTRAFNLNVLKRFNDELGADFNLENFDHFPAYNPIEKSAKSYIVSLKNQTVNFKSADEKIDFKQNEPIKVEISQKYSLEDIEAFAKESGFEVAKHFFDCKHYFVDTLLKK
jgi:L-histidine Nalpha-methyltransferase